VTLIQNDGSPKSAILNCITLALINAGISMKDFLVSSTVAHKHNSIIGKCINKLDLTS
jgi:exosome complex component RRP41